MISEFNKDNTPLEVLPASTRKNEPAGSKCFFEPWTKGAGKTTNPPPEVENFYWVEDYLEHHRRVRQRDVRKEYHLDSITMDDLVKKEKEAILKPSDYILAVKKPEHLEYDILSRGFNVMTKPYFNYKTVPAAIYSHIARTMGCSRTFWEVFVSGGNDWDGTGLYMGPVSNWTYEEMCKERHANDQIIRMMHKFRNSGLSGCFTGRGEIALIMNMIKHNRVPH